MKRIYLIMLVVAATMMMSCKHDNKIAGHEYVDLGLPSGLKWATCNVGAENPEESGNYYAWGETVTKDEYTEDNSLIFGLSRSELKAQGIIDEKNHLTQSYDAAAVNWGGSWRMPTSKEFGELIDNCTFERTTQNGIEVCKVTSKTNGNYIFLPITGYMSGSELVSGNGYYWSSTPNSSKNTESYFLVFNEEDGCWCSSVTDSRPDGMAVRPVSK